MACTYGKQRSMMLGRTTQACTLLQPSRTAALADSYEARNRRTPAVRTPQPSHKRIRSHEQRRGSGVGRVLSHDMLRIWSAQHVHLNWLLLFAFSYKAHTHTFARLLRWTPHQTSFSRSLMTPIAVTAAPAPAPWMTSGRAPYRSVWNMMMLSDPPSAVANGCVAGYLLEKAKQACMSNTERQRHEAA